MPVLRVETIIGASAETCFDIALDVDVQVGSTSRSRERALAGVTHGKANLGDTITWEAVHFGVRQRLTAKITKLERPRLFVDEMVSGAFERLRHTHEFIENDHVTRMIDLFDYASPWGVLGRLADRAFL